MLSGQIQIRHIKTTSEFEGLREQWDRLRQNSPTQDAFLTWEWLFAWWKHYGKQKSLEIITAWNDDEMVGVLPLMRTKKRKYGLNFRVLCTLGAPQSDVGGVLIKGGNSQILTMVYNSLLEQKKSWDIVELNQFQKNSVEFNALIPAFELAGFGLTQKDNKHFYIHLEGDWNSYYEQLSKKFRKNLRRGIRSAEETGKVSLSHYTGSEVTWQHFQTIIRINRYSHFPLIYNSKEEQSFHKELIELMAARNWLDIFLLCIDDEPVAYEYGFIYDGRLENWRGGFDTRLDPTMSVGKLLSMMVVQESFALGYKEIDFLRGDEYYKTEWEPENREFTKIQIVSPHSPLSKLIFIQFPKIKRLLKDRYHRK